MHIRMPYTESQKELIQLMSEKNLGSSITFTRIKLRDKFDTITEWKAFPLRQVNNHGEIIKVADYATVLASGADEQSLRQFVLAATVIELGEPQPISEHRNRLIEAGIISR